jgi:hypothetical protein
MGHRNPHNSPPFSLATGRQMVAGRSRHPRDRIREVHFMHSTSGLPLRALAGLFVTVSFFGSAPRALDAQDANPLRGTRIPATARDESQPVAPRRILPAERISPGVNEGRRVTYQSEEWLDTPRPNAGLAFPSNGPYLPEEYEFEEETWPMWGGRLKAWLPAWGRPFYHGDPNDPDRATGKGHPLVGTSWLNRPLSVGFFAGGLFGDEPFDSRVEQGGGFLGGFRLGYDFDHYTGAELRVGLSQLELFDNQNVPFGRTSNFGLFDLNLLYYPWGDSRIRPYATFGLGIAAIDTFDEVGRNYNDALLLMPFGVGLKYYHGPFSVFRVDVLDNLAFGNNRIDTMHNLSISAGWEIRYGANPKLYYPAHPGVERW